MADIRPINAGDQEQEPIVRVINTVIIQAILAGASDIEMDLSSAECVVSYRIADSLREEMRVPGYISPPLIEHLRKMASLHDEYSIGSESGTFLIRFESNDYQLKLVQTHAENGEKITLSFVPVTA